MSRDQPTVEEIVLAADGAAWSRAGFAVEGDVVRVGAVDLRLAGADAGRRIVRCTIGGVASEELDGLPIARSDGQHVADPPPPHPNGVVRIDHLVAFTVQHGRRIATVRREAALGLPVALMTPRR